MKYLPYSAHWVVITVDAFYHKRSQTGQQYGFSKGKMMV